MEVLSDFSAYFDLAFRVVATSGIVIVVALLVGKLGPMTGGVIAGLPIGLGPGFWFLLADSTPAFLSLTATSSLVALVSTQLFLLCYAAFSLHKNPFAALALAVMVWLACSVALGRLALDLISAAILFLGVTFITYRIGRKFSSGTAGRKAKERNIVLAFRAICAGILVGLVTTISPFLGPHWSGLLLAFPIGFALIGFTIHRRFGPAIAAALLHSTILGTLGLASFCVGMGVGLEISGKIQAFWIAMSTSVLTTSALTLATQFLKNTNRP